tara:strand:- start:531 stop:1421 length:891 start_codon:yes stop_codon:yes gene_type:complete
MNFYEILDIDKKSTTSEIKKKYYKLAKLYHPDKNGDMHVEKTFVKISEAYNTLSDPIKRYKYDIELEFSNVFNTDLHLHLNDQDIKILHKYYSKIRSSTEYRFLKLLFDNLPKNKEKYKNRYNLIDISKYKYIDITNVENDYIINLQLSFEDTYLNKCKILIIKTKSNYFYLFITHTNSTFIMYNSNHLFTVNILTENSDKYVINNHDIYIYKTISLYDFIFHDTTNVTLPNNITFNYKITSLEPTIIPHLGLKNPNTHKREKLIIYYQINLLEKKNLILKNITQQEKHILYKLFS